jgi:hypothetical protein
MEAGCHCASGWTLSRTGLDVHVMDESGAPLAVITALPDAGGLLVLGCFPAARRADVQP